jgi:hypothetical protein
MYKQTRRTIACGLWLLAAVPGWAGDVFVVTATFPSQGAAQTEAAVRGGWVLDTDVYPNLGPGKFAVVRGPYPDGNIAVEQLRSLRSGGGYVGAYVKDAGKPRLPVDIGSPSLRPQLLAALLGELSIEVTDHPGGEHPCEPEEPYQAVRLSFVDLTRSVDDKPDSVRVEAERRDVEVGAFWIIRRTGEIDRMRQCYE